MDTHSVYPLKLRNRNSINYTYVIVDHTTRQLAIIDPAWELAKIESTMHMLNGHLTTILLTHSHNDHVNLVHRLLEKYNPQVYLSHKEIHYYNFACENLHPFEDNDVIMLGDTSVSCMLTPGHTYGSSCFLISNDLFTGDTVFIEGCGLCDTVGGDPDKMFHSIQRIKSTIKPEVQIFPGHSYGKDPGYTLEYLLRHNIYFQFINKEHFINFRMRKGQKNLFNFC
ncbi:MBL fold metallo-hydrolase [Paenibacillus hexagrammi]|uniref:MBL fold metallo-hydrolase n=1 Tax=Paenibacillus hexagrammi TaxID=2908839 RepID=A0ABY3SLD4_9BACL|nr:MBL fold metallo-hydrolase [Paenibacillus sp. YPD9-1]UJF34766.1 MBL fold metallo-hydrolase [Paenibacillus sp. YPD9-1]